MWIREPRTEHTPRQHGKERRFRRRELCWKPGEDGPAGLPRADAAERSVVQSHEGVRDALEDSGGGEQCARGQMGF